MVQPNIRIVQLIIDKLRAALIQLGIYEEIYDDALCNIYIKRILSKSIDNEIPFEIWTGKSVSYKQLKTFGCVVCGSISKQK